MLHPDYVGGGIMSAEIMSAEGEAFGLKNVAKNYKLSLECFAPTKISENFLILSSHNIPSSLPHHHKDLAERQIDPK